jgi:hypothetical protein
VPSFRVLGGRLIDFERGPLWMIRVAVRTSVAEVGGWAFIDPEHIELRFEMEPDGEPPGFLTGRYLLEAGYNNSLAQLFENPSVEAICWVEVSIQLFLEKCLFCVMNLLDLKTHNQIIKVIGYRYEGGAFNVLNNRNNKGLRDQYTKFREYQSYIT